MDSFYKHYEGLPIEDVVRLELRENGFIEEDLTADQLERFKDEMKRRIAGEWILDGVLTEIPVFTEARLERWRKEEEKNNQEQSI